MSSRCASSSQAWRAGRWTGSPGDCAVSADTGYPQPQPLRHPHHRHRAGGHPRQADCAGSSCTMALLVLHAHRSACAANCPMVVPGRTPSRLGSVIDAFLAGNLLIRVRGCCRDRAGCGRPLLTSSPGQRQRGLPLRLWPRRSGQCGTSGDERRCLKELTETHDLQVCTVPRVVQTTTPADQHRRQRRGAQQEDLPSLLISCL